MSGAPPLRQLGIADPGPGWYEVGSSSSRKGNLMPQGGSFAKGETSEKMYMPHAPARGTHAPPTGTYSPRDPRENWDKQATTFSHSKAPQRSNITRNADVPGPGHYSLKPITSAVGGVGVSFGKSPRKNTYMRDTSKDPGPQSYYPEPAKAKKHQWGFSSSQRPDMARIKF